MKKFMILLWLPVFWGAMMACDSGEFGEGPYFPESKLSDDELDLRMNMKELALAMAWLADAEDVQQEAFQLVQLGYEMTNRVLFRHFIEQPEYNSLPLRRRVRGALKRRLLNHASLVLHGRNGIERADPVQYMLDRNLEIYWPYWQEWDQEETPTVTFNPLNGEEANQGFRLSVSPDGTRRIDTVMVSDDYAFAHPVWIIDRHRHLPAEHPMYNAFANGSGVEKLRQSRVRAASDGNHEVNKIYIRHVKLTRNFRWLFGGENRIVVHVADENVALGHAPQQSSFIIDRWAARKGVWREPNQLLKLNWKPYEVSNYFIFEGIKSGKNTAWELGGNIQLSAKVADGMLEIGPEINLFGWSVNIERKNEVMAQYEMERTQFFSENWTDAYRHGMQAGCAVRMGSFRRGTIYYTLDADGYDY